MSAHNNIVAEVIDGHDWEYISTVVNNNITSLPHVVNSAVPVVVCSLSGNILYRPSLMIWAPGKQLGLTPFCPFHGIALREQQPIIDPLKRHNSLRKLYHLNGVVHLVAAKYTCSGEDGNRGHTIISTDEGILQQTGQAFPTPFKLYHKTGLTQELARYVSHRVMTGNKFHDVALFLKDEVRQSMKVKVLESQGNLLSPAVTPEKLMAFLGRVAPGAELLRHAYLTCIRQHHAALNPNEQPISAKWISMDHTFKVSVNIGLERDDGAWVPLYDSLFIVLNEHGIVLHYKLVKGRSFQCVEEPLRSIHERLLQSESSLEGICIDNCCHWRRQLNRIFGMDIPVKLDLFHAVQRVLSTVPKADPVRAEFCREMRLVFRQACDQGKTRVMETPNVAELERNMKAFAARASQTGAATQTALSNLNNHVVKGCLSELPAGCGTNRNERLHRTLNASALSVGRIGPELANALLIGLFHTWNSRKSGKGWFLPAQSRPVSQRQPVSEAVSPASPSCIDEVPACGVAHQCEPGPGTTGTSCPVTDLSRVHDQMQSLHSLWRYVEQQPRGQALYTATKFALAFQFRAEILNSCMEQSTSVRSPHPVRTPAAEVNTWIARGTNGETPSTLAEALDCEAAEHNCNLLLTTTSPVFPGVPFISDISVAVYELKYVGRHGDNFQLEVSSKKENYSNIPSEATIARSGCMEEDECPRCRCGERKGPGHGQPCISSAKYKSRCPCLRAVRPCSAACGCQRCGNPHGARPSLPTAGPVGRRNPRHSTARASAKRVKSVDYIQDNQEAAPQGRWLDVESIALVLIRKSADSGSALLEMYSELVEVCCKADCVHGLRGKSLRQLQSKREAVTREWLGCSSMARL